MTGPTIAGHRIRLRPLGPDDQAHLIAQARSPGFFDHVDISPALRHEYGPADADNYLQQAVTGWSQGRPTWAIEVDGQFAGTIRIRRSRWHTGDEIGYGLMPVARGQGYATEAVQAALAWSRTMGRALPWARTKQANEASGRVLQRAGYERAGGEGDWQWWRPTDAAR